jgi:2-hydroxychromene-2-carboxylate isomerase
VAHHLFAGFSVRTVPASTLPALALAAAGYRTGAEIGEQLSLRLREALFEEGRNIGERSVLDDVASSYGVEVDARDVERVLADHREGAGRGVVGSPHFFTSHGDWFCPALDIHRNDDGELVVEPDPAGFDAFANTCFA